MKGAAYSEKQGDSVHQALRERGSNQKGPMNPAKGPSLYSESNGDS